MIYEDGIYKKKGAQELKKFVQYLGGNGTTNKVVDEVIGAVSRYTACRYSETFNIGTDLIPVSNGLLNWETGDHLKERPPGSSVGVSNGLLNWETGDLAPFDPKIGFTFKLPVVYDPGAGCGAWQKFVNEITETPEDVLILQEFFGYCLFRGYPLAKLLLLVGDGRNGKSTLLSILMDMLGRDNCSNRYLQSLSERFTLGNLVEKLANIAPDIPAKDVLDTAVIKTVSGNDQITVENKYQLAYSALLYAKLIFSANKLPRINDDTSGFYSRIKLINFPYAYKDNPKPGERQADIHLKEKLLAELPGILNWSLEGLRRLMKKEAFTENAMDDNTKVCYQVYSDPAETVSAFISRFVERGQDYRVSSS